MKVLKEYSIIRFLKNVQIKKKSCRIVVNNLELSLFEKQVHGTGESFQRKNQVRSSLTGGPTLFSKVETTLDVLQYYGKCCLLSNGF